MSKSFNQYSLCSVCKTNHCAGKKHVYSRKHRETVENLLRKFDTKIQEGLCLLHNPVIHDMYWEYTKKFWCYFCEKEVERHEIQGDVTISCGGLLKHLASENHLKALKHFWWQNKLDKSKISTYSISVESLNKFLKLIPQKIEEYLKNLDHLHKKDIDHIRFVEQQRMQLVQNTKSEYAVEQLPLMLTGDSQPVASTSVYHNEVFNIRNTARTEKNIFTGALPPWLQNDQEEKNSLYVLPVGHRSKDLIGPTAEEFLKHVSKKSKRHLNPKRVGANFDHNTPNSGEWLPSFGRVWNFGRRWQSRHQFKQELGKTQKGKKMAGFCKSTVSSLKRRTL
ncbi:centrosomal AT-AC splicing factor-like isoform X1 [Tachypleus tridentatus]|uniref:centrosomal AT-AC splicing factor-like isoform X1 n=1 Tax=Tachypleus tridentatus TaxID=6853 RepID=UPI003FD4740A